MKKLREKEVGEEVGTDNIFIEGKILFVCACLSTLYRGEKPLFASNCVPIVALFREVAGSWLRQRSCWYLGYSIMASNEVEQWLLNSPE